MEQTLVILKPDTVQRALVGEIITRFEKAGLKIIGMKMIAPDKEHFHEHYEGISKIISRWGEAIYDINLTHMVQSPVIAIVLEGVEAVSHVRKMVGETDPKESAPGTIRGDFTHISRNYSNKRGGTLPNLVHASGNVEEAEQEIKLWFNASELYDYQTAHEAVVHGIIPAKK